MLSPQIFFLDPAFEGTLQQQIQHLVTSAILAGRIGPGDKLPSSRRLADHLGVSRITVTLAYNEMISNDYLTSRGRSGYFVSENAPRPPPFKLATRAAADDSVDWSRALGQRFAQEPSLTRPEDWRKYPFPFIYGQADPTVFDHRNWRHCALQALGQRDFDPMTADYYERDDPRLVDEILRHILPRRGIAARPEEVLLTLGAQNALWITAQILLTQRRRATMENPCYFGLREILEQTRCHTTAVDVDAGGLDPDKIPSDTDVVFVTPSHHCPTNATLPVHRRRRLLERAEEDDFLIVEDDYEFEMSFLGRPSPALKSLDRSGRVIYIGSFSKSVFPGLRLGYLVGSPAFIREARALRALVVRPPPGHLQRTTAYFLSLGHYDAQLRRLSATYQERRAVMEKAIADHGLTVAGRDQFGGSSFWMQAPPHVDTHALARNLRQKGVLIEPGRGFFPADRPNDTYYRLAYSSIPANKIAEGIARLAKAMAQSGPKTAA